MKMLRQLSVAVLCLAYSSAFAGGEISDIDRMVYGDDPLHPSQESLLGGYLAETGADTIIRSFPYAEGGKPGPQRLVVFVSEATFPIFQKYFSSINFLYEFHEPHGHVFYSAFKDKRGGMGRLRDTFRFTYAGVLAIPILLTDDEGKRAEQFFDLALKVNRRDDVVLFPWRLSDGNNQPYCAPGNEKTIADWFVRMPIGKKIPTDTKQFRPYDLNKITPQTVALPYLPDVVRTEIQNVWTAPEGHESLAQTIGLPELEAMGPTLTPGKIGAALVGSASIERVPVVFRYVNNHKLNSEAALLTADELAADPDRKAIPKDFDTYFDLEFNPAAGQ